MIKTEQIEVGTAMVQLIWSEGGELQQVERHYRATASDEDVFMAMCEIEDRVPDTAELSEPELNVTGRIIIDKWKVQYGTETE